MKEVSNQTPRQRLVRIINRFNKANPVLSKLDYAPTELVDAILAVTRDEDKCPGCKKPTHEMLLPTGNVIHSDVKHRYEQTPPSGPHMTPQSPKTPLETFEAAISHELVNYGTSTLELRANAFSGPEYAAIRQAAITYKDAEVRAALEYLRDNSSGGGSWRRVIELRLAALPNPDAGEME